MAHFKDVGRLHVFWSNSVSWKQGLVSFKVVEHNAYPMWGRRAIESGERLFYRNDFFSLSFMIGSRGIVFHWHPRSRKRPTET